MKTLSYSLVIFLSLGVTGYAVFVYGFLPLGSVVHPDMRVTFEAHRFAIYMHIFASSLALLLGPFQFSTKLRVTRPLLHRWMGRFYLGLGVLLGGTAGLFMASQAFGGLWAKLGFTGMALAWLYTGLRAYLAIRKRDVAAHRRWMLRNFALTFAAVTFRIWLPASFALDIDFEVSYPVVAWISWVPNLLLTEFALGGFHRGVSEEKRSRYFEK